MNSYFKEQLPDTTGRDTVFAKIQDNIKAAVQRKFSSKTSRRLKKRQQFRISTREKQTLMDHILFGDLTRNQKLLQRKEDLIQQSLAQKIKIRSHIQLPHPSARALPQPPIAKRVRVFGKRKSVKSQEEREGSRLKFLALTTEFLTIQSVLREIKELRSRLSNRLKADSLVIKFLQETRLVQELFLESSGEARLQESFEKCSETMRSAEFKGLRARFPENVLKRQLDELLEFIKLRIQCHKFMSVKYIFDTTEVWRRSSQDLEESERSRVELPNISRSILDAEARLGVFTHIDQFSKTMDNKLSEFELR